MLPSLLLCLALPCIAATVEPLPAAEIIIPKLLERSESLAAETNSSAWIYDKRTTIERLDSKSEVEERTEKLYRITIIRGVPFSRLIKIEGRDLTADEIQKEDERETEFRKKISGRDPGSAVAEREALVTEDLVNRYTFQTLRRESIHGRPALVLAFTPNPGKRAESKPHDHLLSRLAGTLWVDETTADVVRLEVQLTQPFSLGVLGVLGSVKACRFQLASRPMPDGTWLPETTSMALTARMLFSGIRVRVTEQSTNYRCLALTNSAGL